MILLVPWFPILPGTANTTINNTQLQATTGAAVKIGDLINVSVAIGENAGTPSGGQIQDPTNGANKDSLGNIYTNTARFLDATNGEFIELWKSIVTVAGVPTVTIQYNPSPGTTQATNASLNVDPFTGSDSASATDGPGSTSLQVAPGTGAGGITSGDFIIARIGDLVYAACIDTSSGADPGTNASGFVAGTVSGGVVLRSQYKIEMAGQLVGARFTATTGTDTFITACHAITPAAGRIPVGRQFAPMPTHW